MSIDRLSSTSALIAALRAEVVRKGDRSTRTDGAATPERPAATARRRDAAVLKRELGEIVKGVAPEDREAVNAVRPRIARAILLWEFGAELREHPDWQPMLDDIVRTLEGSEQHQAQLSALIKQLRAKS
jgi:hypothetical protein